MTRKTRKRIPTFAEAVVDIIDLCMFESHGKEKNCKCHRRVEALLQAKCKTAHAEGFNKAMALISIRADRYRKS